MIEPKIRFGLDHPSKTDWSAANLCPPSAIGLASIVELESRLYREALAPRAHPACTRGLDRLSRESLSVEARCLIG